MPGQSYVGAAYVSTIPPVSGVDPAPQVHADLGSAAIPVTVQTNGAANWATTQVALNSASTTLIFAARATRRSAIVTNTDAAITIYVGLVGVTSATGQPIAPGNSLTIPTTAAIYGISASATPTAAGSEAFD